MTEAELLAFEPSAERATFLDQKMRRDLAASLRHVFEQADGRLDLTAERAQTFLNRIEAHPVSPLAFSLYCDAVIAIENGELEEASEMLAELIQFPAHPGGPQVFALADPARDPAAQRIARFIDTDPNVRFEVFSPSATATQNCQTLIREAFALMEAADPSLAAEIRALLREIILAAGSEDPKAMTFDGASSFMLWGGIVINANQRDSVVAMVQMLAHESTHNLLFGLGADVPLVENPDDELFPSPLRRDARPMDGIYHATFVLARMHRAVRRLLDSHRLAGVDLERARKDLAECARLFADGFGVVQQHGKLSPVGRALMDGARQYMESVGVKL